MKDLRDASCSSAIDASFRTGATRRVCAWCAGEIPPRARRDALCCSVRCRQARHRFRSAVGGAPVAAHRGQPLRLAYADPPYPGKAWLYRGHPDFAGEVDHRALIRRLSTYDGWALSTSAAALPQVLALCTGVRVAAWHRGERPTRSAGPLNGWEPVIYRSARHVVAGGPGVDERRVDSLVYAARPRLTDPRRVVGAKPATFARWVFELLGAMAGDKLDDLYPGSGGITRAWATYTEGVAPVDGRDASVPDPRDASRCAAATRLGDPHDASRLQECTA